MALQKQSLSIPFAQGLDLKTDPNQVAPGKFLSLQNTIFRKSGRLTKRNGFAQLTTLNADNLNTITTYNGNLTAIGNDLFAFSMDSEQWIDKGKINSVKLKTLSLVRSSTAQTTVDLAVTTEGLVCTVWTDSGGTCNYQIIDGTTGQVIVPSTTLPVGASTPRVFLVGNYFVITFAIVIAATPHLQYIAISANNVNIVTGSVNITSQLSALGGAYDGQIINNQLYLAWNGSDGGGAVRITYIDSTLTQHITVALAGQNATKISICADTTGNSPDIWLSYVDSTPNTKSTAFTSQLVSLLAPTTVLTGVNVYNLTSFAKNHINTIFYETNHTYSFSSVRSDFISSVTITLAGSVGSPMVIVRSVGLLSKAFQINNTVYMLTAYNGAFQPTYFLIDSVGNIIAKLAYSNGGGYPSTQILSNAIVNGSIVQIGYLFKDLLLSVNKEQSGAPGGIYSQTGINMASFDLSNSVMPTAEIGGSLHFASGFLWMYDGVKPVEHGFHVWPEDIVATTASVGGNLEALQYFYQVTYEWTDSQGNIHRSAPSVPVNVDLTGSMTSTNQVTLNIPTLRLTYKTAPNSVRIMIWRWSQNNQEYFQVTSIASPVINNPAVDSVTYIDNAADSSIIGNPLIYTTGGVLENIGAPACNGLALFKSRLFLIDAEDTNLIWFSKQVIENTPVETSDLLTEFVAPTTGTQGSTGPVTVISAMDDKFIIFKKDAPYYITGTGPDNTGANNDFSDPIFITSSVGCNNFQSVVLMPQGLMMQTDKGIWLLGRDLSTQYIGAPVEDFNSSFVESALTIPQTNQVRFTLNSGSTLMYNYYYGQWGEFTNIPALSSCIYQGLHTYLDKYGRIFQETPGLYLDGTNPVLMAFKTGWMSLAGLQGFERAYFFYLLGQFLSPHKIQIQLAYDYNPYPSQTSVIAPDNFNTNWGGDSLWGSSSPWGGNSSVEEWRVFLQKQKCEAFQISLNEIYDSNFGVPAGAGFTLSGINLVIGTKSQYPRLAPKYSVG